MSIKQSAPVILQAALRSATVARLAGATSAQLRYWHESLLAPAHLQGGRRGIPRLWSFQDYMKVRAAVRLRSKGLTTQRVRAVVKHLDSVDPSWFLHPVDVFGRHATIDWGGVLELAQAGRQQAIRHVVEYLEAMASEMQEEGPLGSLHRYSNIIEMNPQILGGAPVIKGTRIEPEFVAALYARGTADEEFAAGYGLSSAQVAGAVEFSREVA